MTGLFLRPFTGADREAAVALFLELNRHEHAISGDRRTDRGGAEFCVDDLVETLGKGVSAVVADLQGTVVGLLVWAEREDEAYLVDTARRHGVVQDLVVAESHRGTGIGKALLAEAERLTRAAGLTRLKLNVVAGNDSAIAVYEGAGFRPYSQTFVKDVADSG